MVNVSPEERKGGNTFEYVISLLISSNLTTALPRHTASHVTASVQLVMYAIVVGCFVTCYPVSGCAVTD